MAKLLNKGNALTLMAGPLLACLALAAAPGNAIAGGVTVYESHSSPSRASRPPPPYRGESRVRPEPGRAGDSRVVRDPYPRHRAPAYRAPVYYAPPPIYVPRYPRYYSGVRVHRPYGHPYFGYGFYTSDRDALPWLAFTAITLVLLDQLDEDQQRRHEDAQVRATRAVLGETIAWNEGIARGSVTPVREGASSAGRTCREFRHTVMIGSESEEAYGTACQNPDGSWEIVD